MDKHTVSHKEEGRRVELLGEVVQKAGIDVEKLLDILLRNASVELTT